MRPRVLPRVPPPLRRRLLLAVCCALLVAVLTRGASPGPSSTAHAQDSDQAFVDRVLASMTADEIVGQVVMVNFIGTDVGPDSDIAALIRDFHVGSVIVTASNGNVVNTGDTPGQVAAVTNGLQQRAFESSRRTGVDGEYFLPLLIATDNEGDLYPYSNVTHSYTQLPNNMTIGATWSKSHAEAAGKLAGEQLSAAGVNMLLGPVNDVLENPRSGGNGDIGTRSFGGNAAWVGALARAYVRGAHEGSAGRLLTVAKHFPGHGGSDRSTDAEVPTVNKTLAQLEQSDLAPFAESDRTDDADPAGVTDGMMVSHIRYQNFVSGGGDFTGPISLDAAAFQTLMGLPEFSKWRPGHLVMADSLGVQAVKKWYAQTTGSPDFPNRTIVHDALMAGNDLLPLLEFYQADSGWKTGQLPLIQDSIIYMREQYTADPAFRARVKDAARHVIAEKVHLYRGLQRAQVLVDPVQARAAATLGADDMQSLADDALTLIGPSSADTLPARLHHGPISPDKVLIVECWATDCYPYPVMGRTEMQDALLKVYGPSGKGRLRPEDVSTITFGDLDSWLSKPADPANATTAKALNDASWIIFALTDYNPVARPASGAVKRFLDSAPLDVRGKSLVAIAYNAPYHLDSTEISKLTAYFAAYSKTDSAVNASFRALFGDLVPHGHSPVTVNGIYYTIGDVVQPDPNQTIKLSVYGQDPNAVKDAENVALVAGPILDRNGNPVPDGMIVSLNLVRGSGGIAAASAQTVDGMAVAKMPLGGSGDYSGTATVNGITSPATLAISVGAGGPAPVVEGPKPVASSGSDHLWLALSILIPAGVAALAALFVGSMLYRRRSGAPALATPDGPSLAVSATGVDATVPPPESPSVAVDPPLLRVDNDTRRVYVRGVEAKPGLSNEQFRLLAYLYERAGKVTGREELVSHVWPDAHVEGVSEEALDALVRRVRERIVQAGGERSYIVTLRGQGFRLEI